MFCDMSAHKCPGAIMKDKPPQREHRQAASPNNIRVGAQNQSHPRATLAKPGAPKGTAVTLRLRLTRVILDGSRVQCANFFN
jgi:hypothetical protein